MFYLFLLLFSFYRFFSLNSAVYGVELIKSIPDKQNKSINTHDNLPKKHYNISEIIALAKNNSLNIKSAQSFSLAQQDFSSQEKYWQNPAIGFEFNNQSSGRQSGSGSSNGNNVTISQNLPFFSKLQKKYQIADVDFKILATQSNNLALLVEVEVFSLLFQHYGILQKIELAQKRLKRLNNVSKYLASINLNSPTKITQANIVYDKINLINRELIMLQSDLFNIWQQINNFVDLPQDAVVKMEWPKDKINFNFDGISNLAIENNFTLKLQKQKLDKINKEIAFAKIENMPDLTASVKDSAGNISYGMSINLPIVNRNQSRILGLEKQFKAQDQLYQFEKNRIFNQIKTNLYQYHNLQRTNKILPVSMLNNIVSRLSLADQDFKKGTLDFITYVELDSREYEVVDAIIDNQIALMDNYGKISISLGEFNLPIGQSINHSIK